DFDLGAVCRSVRMAIAIADFAGTDYLYRDNGLKVAFNAAAYRQFLDMLRPIIAAASSGAEDIKTLSFPFAAKLVRACIDSNWRDPIALLLDEHPVFLTPIYDDYVFTLSEALARGRVDFRDTPWGRVGAPSQIPRFLALGADPNGSPALQLPHGRRRTARFSFGGKRLLARLVLGTDWKFKPKNPQDRRLTERRIHLLSTAFDMGLCTVENLSAEQRANFKFDRAFKVATLCRSVPMVTAIARFAVNEHIFSDYGLGLETAFLVAADGDTVLHMATLSARRFEGEAEVMDQGILRVMLERVPGLVEKRNRCNVLTRVDKGHTPKLTGAEVKPVTSRNGRDAARMPSGGGAESGLLTGPEAVIVLRVAHHLHPNNLPVLAGACLSLRGCLNLDNRSLSFAKAHLKAVTRRTMGLGRKYLDGPWDPSWLSRLQCSTPIKLEHPRLFNYAMAAVVPHGFTFTGERHLGKMMLGEDWRCIQDKCNPKNQRRRKLLAAACERGLCRIEDPVMKLWASFNFCFNFTHAFQVAAVFRSVDMVKTIAVHAASDNFTNGLGLQTAFMIAAEHRFVDMMRAILAAASNKAQDIKTVSDPFAETLIRACIFMGFQDPIALLPDNHPIFNDTYADHHRWTLTEAVTRALPDTGTLCAAATYAPSQVRRFLALGADPNSDFRGTTPLHDAAAGECADAVKALVDAGADIEALNFFRYTLLVVACIYGRSHEVVEVLLDAGADLHCAVRGVGKLEGENKLADLEILRAVLKLEQARGLINRRDAWGRSPLDLVGPEFLSGEVVMEARRMLNEAGAVEDADAAMESLSFVVVLEVARNLHPNALITLAAVCKWMRQSFTLDTLSLPFAKKHLEAITRRTTAKNGEYLGGPWNPRWLHLLQRNRPIDFDHPLLINYAMAAVALHGFTFLKARHLGKLILGKNWDLIPSLPEDRQKRERRIQMLKSAYETGLCSIEDLSNPKEVRRNENFHQAFKLAAMCRSTDMVTAIANNREASSYFTYEYYSFNIEGTFYIAASHRFMDMIRIVLSAVSNGTQDIETVNEPFAGPLLRACIAANFRDPISLFPTMNPSSPSPHPPSPATT
ncbi:hypothetical protein HDU96_004781, partial [Phlyctochytrium bullatum]